MLEEMTLLFSFIHPMVLKLTGNIFSTHISLSYSLPLNKRYNSVQVFLQLLGDVVCITSGYYFLSSFQSRHEPIYTAGLTGTSVVRIESLTFINALIYATLDPWVT